MDDVLGAPVCLGQRHLDLALDVLASARARARPSAPTEEVVGVGEAAVRGLTEQGAEEIREPAGVVAERAFAGLPRVYVFEPAGPGGTSAPLRELFPVGTDGVITLALLGVAEDLVGLIDLFEFLFRVRLLVYVRVVLARELSVGLLDVVDRGVLRNAKRLVVVLVLDRHRLEPRRVSALARTVRCSDVPPRSARASRSVRAGAPPS